MKRITKLSAEQIARMPEWVDRWIKIGLCTDPADFDTAEKAMRKCYEVARLTQPVVVLRMSSPWSAIIGGVYAAVLVRAQVEAQVGDQVCDQVRAQVRAQVFDQVYAQVEAQVFDQVRDKVYGQVYAQVDAHVEEQVRDQVRAQVRAQVEAQVREEWINYRGCQLWASWYSFVSFFRDVCGWENSALEKFSPDEQLTLSCGLTWWGQTVGAISDRPLHIHRNTRGQLHCGTAKALEYRDGWGVWCWNGTRVTEQIILRPDTLTPVQIAQERNAQVRQVMVERVGIERVCQMFKAKSINTQGDYALLLLDLGDGRKRPYLKMKNPSVGCFHIEGVHPTCTTVQQAINWRASGDIHSEWKPEVLS